jgi:hypothetical protein
MSEPTIWDIAMGGKPPEKFVPYEEYKKLETDNARLKADVNELADGLKLASEVGIKMADEVTRLKAEVERLTLAYQGSVKYVDHTMALTRQSMEHHKEVARLKAEVERLTAFATRTIIPNDELQAQVERLTKAGDAMAEDLLNEFGRKEMLKCQPYQDWLSAKKGKTNE